MSRKTTIFALAGILVVASTGTFITLLTASPAGAEAMPGPCDEADPCTVPSETVPDIEDACEDCEETPTVSSGGSGGSDGSGNGVQIIDACQAIDLQAEALDNGPIHVTWVLPDGARGVSLLRDGIQIADLAQPAAEFLDETTAVGATYAYVLQVYFPGDPAGEPTQECNTEVTAVPVFGSALAGSLAVGLGVLAYVSVRRRD